ncbi:MAG: ATP phosphoribosyltransferase [Deltaproteobacteria bacterium]|nr:ATP phosphoribosyltransferase [Candidatus Zymogenaceae bacterium]
MIRLALPDGHQQKHIIGLLEKTGIELSGYDPGRPLRRPRVNLDGVEVTVIRPQDMPAQVALGNFDLALTGVDWLYDHLFRFPKSPVAGLLDLGIGRVRIVAVVTEDTPADDLSGINRLVGEGYFPAPFFRVASEYVNIADRFAMARRFSHYRVIPTYGATEALLPEDADMIVENTETGTTLVKNKLKIVDELFISVGCLIGRRGIMDEGRPGATRVYDEIRGIDGVSPHSPVEM